MTLLDRRAHGDYYAALEAKHFAATGIGSYFTDVATLEELLELAVCQRGTLAGDDRDLLAGAGAEETAFTATARYLLVHTAGRLGIVRSEDLDDDTPVRVTAAKPGCPVSLSVAETSADHMRDVTIATVVIGPTDETETGEMVYTAHPGVPTPPAPWSVDGDPYAVYAGTEISLGDVRRIHGGDLWLQLHT